MHPPLLELFERRILCSLDPTEVCFFMQCMEMGQNHHQEFASIGLNTYGADSRVPGTSVRWKTYFPLVDTEWIQPAPRPAKDVFSTVGQWYWDGCVEWDGEWRDFSKKAAFEKFLDLPKRISRAAWVLAMNLNSDDPEIPRIKKAGWGFRHPHHLERTPRAYLHYLSSCTAEFSAVKLESFARSGWLSDRSAVYLALGRPVITESTGAEPYLPEESGIFFVADLEEAVGAAEDVLNRWDYWSAKARSCAVECFDSVRNLKAILV